MSDTKSVKALKKQLVAAIAMVLVAGVALGASTYAWFVSNNSVTATTTNISAQSNSAYLVIDTTATSTTSTSATTANTPEATALYPATVVKDNNNAVWKTGYASDKNNAAIKGELTTIGTNGTAEEANTAKYNIKNTFYVGTGTYDGKFTNLKVTGLEVNNTASSDLNTAIRVLVTDGTAWVVVRPVAVLGKDAYVVDGTDSTKYHLATAPTDTTKDITADAYNALKEKTAITTADTKWEIESQSGTDGIVHAAEFGQKADVTLSVYVYYEGSDGRVYTTNLEQLKNIGVTITFEATPVLHEGKN